METPFDDNLLFRFLNRETSEEENSKIFGWLDSSEENKIVFRKIHKLHQMQEFDRIQAKINVDTAWNRLYGKINKNSSTKIIYLQLFRRIAVSVLLVLMTGAGFIAGRYLLSGKEAIVEVVVPKGEKSKIILADGSTAWINSQSVLKYDALNPRRVKLSGEAYFEVKTDHQHPFEVETLSGMKVKVTGTKFNLRCFSDDPLVETTLDEGEVIISTADSRNRVILKPGQQARYYLSSRQIQVDNVDTGIFSIWKNNELRFSGISFRDLVPRIERWYGVSIDLDPTINTDDRFKMTIKTESLRELLTMMQLTSKFTYEINGSKIHVHAK